LHRKLLLLFLLGMASLARAQTIVSGTITGAGTSGPPACLSIDVTGQGVVGISITNTATGSAWSGTIQPEVAIGSDAPQNVTVTPYNSTTAQPTITANGNYNASVSGASTFYVCGNTVTNIANVKLQAVKLSGKLGGSGSGGSGTVSANNGSAGAVANYAAAGGSTTVGPDATLTDNGTTLTYTGANGLNVPAGSLANPSLSMRAPTLGFFSRLANILDYTPNGTSTTFDLQASSWTVVSGMLVGWVSSSSDASSSGPDTSFCRGAAGLLQFSTTACNAQANTRAASFTSAGTKFTTNNGCTDSATAGGATAGTFTVGSTSCTEVITMGNSATALNGWSCTAIDITTVADVTNPHQTTTTTTTATIVTGTVVSGDKIQFSCIGY
jgi:hypothetical protein